MGGNSAKQTAENASVTAQMLDVPGEVLTGDELEQALNGLTPEQVAQARERGETNAYVSKVSRSVKQIVLANTLTLFNAILATCVVLVLIFGHLQDALFSLILVVNSATGIISELRAKRTLERMSILDQAPLLVVRDGVQKELAPQEIVLGDTICLRIGDQVPVDGVVLTEEGLRLNESNLTGESVPQWKKQGDQVLSGSAVTSGKGYIKATAVGANSWANQMSAKVKRFSLARSELQESIRKVLKWITFALPFIVVLLVWAQVRAAGGLSELSGPQFAGMVVVVVAAIVGMIPQGLVLLTSINFATASVLLARKGVLVQEMPAVEILARVDALCLDKTGTLTTGEIVGRGVVPLKDALPADAVSGAPTDGGHLLAVGSLTPPQLGALYQLTRGRDNATAVAIADMLVGHLSDELCAASEPTQTVPFDSSRKWSAVADGNHVWVLGAPEFVFELGAGHDSPAARRLLQQVNYWADQGQRTLALGCANVESIEQVDDEYVLPAQLEPVALLVLGEQLRTDAAATLRYFEEQGVEVYVISGDNPATVAALAKRAGVKATGFDARELPTDLTELRKLVQTEHVFGRVRPEQKRALVAALQANGKTVAMTGDGVNDALALKDSDLGIAMGNATSATKAAAKIVLVDSKFGALPAVVGEGRRVLGNMERVSTLFLSKTIYAMVIALSVGVLGMSFPYLPRQLTLVADTTIGIPAFFLALAPSHQRYRPGFLKRVGELVIPAGLVCALTSLAAYILVGGWHQTAPGRPRSFEMEPVREVFLQTRRLAELHAHANVHVSPGSTAATITLCLTALLLLAILARPLLTWRGILVLCMAGVIAAAITVPFARRFFALTLLTAHEWLIVAGLVAAGALVLVIAGQVWYKRNWRSELGTASMPV